jgi:hypothetical protein
MRTAFLRPLALFVVISLVVASIPTQASAATVVVFTTSTTWTVPAGVTSVSVLVVAGGGGGGTAGGGGGGGVVYNPIYTVTPGASLTVTIGAGGAALNCNCTAVGNSGTNSVFDTITALGGGGGGAYAGTAALSGGSGGGGGNNTTNTGGAATQGNSGGGIGYGYAGGAGSNSSSGYTAGGGGGAGAAGNSASGSISGTGGQGYLSNISGTATYYSGGGGGGCQTSCTAGNGGAGGGGGGGVWSTGTAGTGGSNGGASGSCCGGVGGNGGVNSGGGGGGMGISIQLSGAGGSGIVIVSYGAPSITLTQDTTVTGNASVLGTISKGSGTFVIDYPLDPKNKLLYHSFVESSDVKNIYDGIVQLDGDGSAIVTLPDYFLALNKDFRYLATPIGQSMSNLFISSEVHRKFWIFGQIILKVSGGVSNGKVSWQVTGIRHDPFILANPIIPVVDKGPGQLVDKNVFICPECYVRAQ